MPLNPATRPLVTHAGTYHRQTGRGYAVLDDDDTFRLASIIVLGDPDSTVRILPAPERSLPGRTVTMPTAWILPAPL